MSNLFMHTQKTLEEKKSFSGKAHINQSGVMTCTITEAKIQGFGSQDKSLVMTLTSDDGAEAKYVSLKYIDDKGEVVEKNLDIIRDMVHFTKAKFNGENPEVFDNCVVMLAIKVVAKKSGKGIGFPQLFINGIFSTAANSKGNTVKELHDKVKETLTKDYWTKAFEKDEPIIKEKEASKGKSMTTEERIAAAGGNVNPAETPSFGDDEDAEIFPF